MSDVSLPVSIVYGEKTTRGSRSTDRKRFELQLLDVVDGMPILTLAYHHTTPPSGPAGFSSLEQAEGWILRDMQWKNRKDDASILERFLIKRHGGWESLHHAIAVGDIKFYRSAIGTRLAREAKGPPSTGTMSLCSDPPFRDIKRGGKPRSSIAIAIGGVDDDVVARGRRCVMRQLSAYYIERHHHPIPSAIDSPVKAQDLFIEDHLGGLCDGDVGELEQMWDSSSDRDKYLWRSRYWAHRVREATDPGGLLDAVGMWHDNVLSILDEDAGSGGGEYATPAPPPKSACSPIAKAWVNHAFIEMTTWLAQAPWDTGVAIGSVFSNTLVCYTTRWIEARVDNVWNPLITKSRKRKNQTQSIVSLHRRNTCTPSALTAPRPDSTRGRKQCKRLIFHTCDDGTAFGAFVSMWFTDTSNWLVFSQNCPETDASMMAPDSVLPHPCVEDVASMRWRIQCAWEVLPLTRVRLVEAEWMRRCLRRCRNSSDMQVWFDACPVTHNEKIRAFRARAREMLRCAVLSGENRDEAMAQWLPLIHRGSPCAAS